MDKSEHVVNRRTFLGVLSTAGAACIVPGCGTKPVEPPILPPPEMTEDLNLRLLNRITFGPTPADIAEINDLGYEEYLERQLNPDAIDDGAAAGRVRGFGTLTQSADRLLDTQALTIVYELELATFIRAVMSKRQLFERMVHFWADHFHTYVGKDIVLALKPVEDREVYRAHALGKFGEMFLASARSPAMLAYLDNAVNVAGHPNENYAREALELHSVGVTGGYVQQDVEELARALTGWTVRRTNPNRGTFEFKSSDHDDGPKRIMDLSLPAGGGVHDGELAIEFLAQHVGTANHIATKLVRHFIAETPPPGLVNDVAASFRASSGDIRETLRVLLSRQAMQQAQPKFKRPYHLVVDATRRAGGDVRNVAGLNDFMFAMGQMPFYWPAPNGYPDTAGYWAPGMLNRWNYAAAFAYNFVRTTPARPRALAQANGADTPEAVVALWDQVFFNLAMPNTLRQTLIEYAAVAPRDADRLYVETFALAISSPEFQWH